VAARLRRAGRRLADLGTGFVEAFVRDNRVLPPVLAVLALFVVAWILAGALMGGPDQEPVAHRDDLAQAQDEPGPNPRTPGVENRDVDSYAAYRSKDPFRELLAPDETTQLTTTTPADPTTPDDRPNRRPPPDGSGDDGSGARDADADRLPDRRERNLGTDPNNPDTDGDGLPDGADDANGDGRPDGLPSTGGPGAQNSSGDDLLDSGGILPAP
jgi:Bacterial TSP3 repeat